MSTQTMINLEDLEARPHGGAHAPAPLKVHEMEALIRRVKEAEKALGLLDFLDDWWSRGSAGEIRIILDALGYSDGVRCRTEATGEIEPRTRDVFTVGLDEHLSAALLDYMEHEGQYGEAGGTVPLPPVGFYAPEVG